jgi:hypothetical protein
MLTIIDLPVTVLKRQNHYSKLYFEHEEIPEGGVGGLKIGQGR